MQANQLLQQELLNRVRKNPSYSLRAMARDLGVSAPFLSQFLNGKKKMSFLKAVEVASLLKLPKPKRDQFLLSVQKQGSYFIPEAKAKFKELNQNYLRLFETWLPLALLDFSTTKNFDSNPTTLARRLCVSVHEIKSAIDLLKKLGLFEDKNGKLIKSQNNIRFQTTKSQAVIRQFHRAMIGKALEELNYTDQADFDAREISAITMAIDPRRMPEAKKLIQDFKVMLGKFLTKEPTTEVYQLNIQLFPLSKSKETKK